MKTAWQPTRLSEVLKPISRTEFLDPTKDYRLLGVRLDGGGPFHRETKPGALIAECVKHFETTLLRDYSLIGMCKSVVPPLFSL